VASEQHAARGRHRFAAWARVNSEMRGDNMRDLDFERGRGSKEASSALSTVVHLAIGICQSICLVAGALETTTRKSRKAAIGPIHPIMHDACASARRVPPHATMGVRVVRGCFVSANR